MSPAQPQTCTTPAPGTRKVDLETPCLCLDLTTFEANLNQIASTVRSGGKNWRPHAKCHKSTDVAKRIVQHGAIGLTCAKVSEAEIFAAQGIRDLLLAHLPVGPGRQRRIAELCRTADPVVTCDHYVHPESLSTECQRQGVICRVLVDVNIGMDRTGIRPGRDAIELAQGIDRLPGLKLVGIMGYEGHVMRMADAQQKFDSIAASHEILIGTCGLFDQYGLCRDIVSAGGTGSLRQALACDVLTEVQAGGAIFGDPFYTEMPDVTGYGPALTVLCTVVSRPSFNRAVLDAGRKAITGEYHIPVVKSWPDARVTMHSAEHIVLELGSSSTSLRIGDQVELIVGYADLTTMLHEQYFCFRGDQLETVWPIEARGKLI